MSIAQSAYSVGLISRDTDAAHSRSDIFYALRRLDAIIDKALGDVSARVDAETKRLVDTNTRVRMQGFRVVTYRNLSH